MEVRLCLNRGGNGTSHGINVLDDTGSDIMTLLYTNLAAMGNYQQYAGHGENMLIGTAGGQFENLLTLDVEIRLVRPGNPGALR